MTTNLKDEAVMHDLRKTGRRLLRGDKMAEHNHLVILLNCGQPVPGVEGRRASNRCSMKVRRPVNSQYSTALLLNDSQIKHTDCTRKEGSAHGKIKVASKG